MSDHVSVVASSILPCLRAGAGAARLRGSVTCVYFALLLPVVLANSAAVAACNSLPFALPLGKPGTMKL